MVSTLVTTFFYPAYATEDLIEFLQTLPPPCLGSLTEEVYSSLSSFAFFMDVLLFLNKCDETTHSLKATTRCLEIGLPRKQSPRDSRTTNRGWHRDTRSAWHSACSERDEARSPGKL